MVPIAADNPQAEWHTQAADNPIRLTLPRIAMAKLSRLDFCLDRLWNPGPYLNTCILVTVLESVKFLFGIPETYAGNSDIVF